MNWCSEHLGPRDDIMKDFKGRWDCHWNDGDLYTWKFVNEEDAILFALKWK